MILRPSCAHDNLALYDYTNAEGYELYYVNAVLSVNPPSINFIQVENMANSRSYEVAFSASALSLCLTRAAGNSLHGQSCGNVIQRLEMQDGSAVDTSIFTFDSSSMDVTTEFTTPRQFVITSDGSVEQQERYEMTIMRTFEDYPDADVNSTVNPTPFNVTILPWNYTNSAPSLKEDVSGKYIVYVNEELVIDYVPYDADQHDTITSSSKPNQCSNQSTEAYDAVTNLIYSTSDFIPGAEHNYFRFKPSAGWIGL